MMGLVEQFLTGDERPLVLKDYLKNGFAFKFLQFFGNYIP